MTADVDRGAPGDEGCSSGPYLIERCSTRHLDPGADWHLDEMPAPGR